MQDLTLFTSQALALGAVMVIDNTRGFGRVEGLVVENWVER